MIGQKFQKIFVVVLHYKGRELTMACLESLKKTNQRGLKVRVLVIDNGSSEPLKWQSNAFIEVIKAGANLGYVGGNNLGIKKALAEGADWVLVLNNDTFLPKDFFQGLVRDDLKGEIIAPKIYFAPGKEYHYQRYQEEDRGKVIWYAGGVIDWHNVYGSHRGVDGVDNGQYDQQEETDFASGCAMLVKRQVWEKIGLFDKKYFLYLEDMEFCCRARRAGFKIVFNPRFYLWHLNASSSSVGSVLQDYFITRNRLLFGWCYASIRTKLALMKESWKILFTGRKWQKKGVRDFYLRRWGKGGWNNGKTKMAQ